MKKVNKNYVNILMLVMGIIFYGCNSDKGNAESNNVIVNTHIAGVSTEEKNIYLLEINKIRSIPQDCGSRGIYYGTIALTWNDKLYKAANEHSNDLAKTNTFSHAGSGQASDLTGVRLRKASTFKERIEAYGYQYTGIGENIASGTNSNTAKKVIAQLMKSDGHCANIMHPDYREIGMAMSKNVNSKYVHYWTQNFGTPR